MAAERETRSNVRMAEVIAALSLATDLGMGQPMDRALRRCVLAVRLGEALSLGDGQLRDVYYVGLVCSVGCTVKLQEFLPWFSDEMAAAAQSATLDPGEPVEATLFVLRQVGRGDPPLRRAQKVVLALATGHRQLHHSAVTCHEVCMTFGDMLSLDPSTRQALGQMHERWDGRGEPARLKGEEEALPARIAHLAGDVELFHRLGGVEAATTMVRQRAGKAYDPWIAQCFCQEAPRLLAGIDAEPMWETVLAAEPAPQRWLGAAELDTLARALAHFADVRSPYTLDHSTGVAALAGCAASELGLSQADAAMVRRAGLLHDLGRSGVPVGIWNKPGPLSLAEWERVRMHPYFTERILDRSAALAPLGALAALHHERLDGSGYHRGTTAPSIPMAARVLAAADSFHTKVEPRPHRPALTAEAAAAAMHQEARAGRLDGDAVHGILAAAGQRGLPRRRSLPAGLSDREVEVLRLVARGQSIREMADTLSISPKTAGHHLQHIYDKIGVSSRVAATLFAMRHDLLGETTP